MAERGRLEGHGRTADADHLMAVEHLAADVAALLDHLDVEQADVIRPDPGPKEVMPSLHHSLFQDTIALSRSGADVDILGALDAATDEFARRLRFVGEESWQLPTPCSDWDVQYLIAHVVGGNRFAVLVLEGTTASEAIERVMSSEQLGDDAITAWTSTCAAQASAFHVDSVLQRPIDHPLGEISGRQFLEFRVFDITLHAWDLARSIGVDDRLDADLVDLVLGIVESGPPGMGFGITALERVSPSASAQAKLLDLTGRSAA